MKLKGKVALVTGASKGIGAGIAVALAGEGAAVAVNYGSDEAGAREVVGQIEAKGGSAIAVQANVSKAGDVAKMVAQTVERFGRLDILVNNAAAYEMAAIEDISEAEYHRHFGTNVLGPILLIQQALNHFGDGGCIINISSTIVLSPEANTALYSGSKAALDQIARVLAKELGPRNIRVNTISPGVTHTRGHPVYDWGEEIVAPLVARTPLGRLGSPEDIAPAAVFLASDEGAWITGATLQVSGGFR